MKVATVLLLVAAAITLTACGDKASGSAGAEAKPAATGTGTAAATAKPAGTGTATGGW